MDNTTIFLTQDGSHSMMSSAYGVSYHSKHGAIQETQHVFIDAALKYKAAHQNQLNILDIGMGTALNAYMTLLTAKEEKLQINYTAIEAYPISVADASTLNYASLLNQEEPSFLFFHECDWNKTHQLNNQFTFLKKLNSFHDIDYANQFDIIYFDAFAPNAQPDLWEAPLLTKMYEALKANGVLTTYCAKGVVKRTLKSIGFEIEGIPGPPGKREMTRATKN